MTENFRYGPDEESMFYDNLEDAISDLINHDSGDDPYAEWVGVDVHILRGLQVEKKPSDFMTKWEVSSLIDSWQERAYDEVGESSESFANDVDRPSLLQHIKEWMDKNLECEFINITNTIKLYHTITKADVDRALGLD